jgi:hypothetical protein
MRVALAKLYQNTGRIADVGAVLEPALKRLYPTLEFDEIAEAQAPLATLT